MVNLRVRDLGAMADQLRAAGIDVAIDTESYPNGRFARIHDPEGRATEAFVRQTVAGYCALITHMDEQIGAVMKVAEDLGLLETTRVLYTSDHGEAAGKAQAAEALHGIGAAVGRILGRPAVLVRRGAGISHGSFRDGKVPGARWHEINPISCRGRAVAR